MPILLFGPVAELVYAQHLKCCAARHVGSTPTWTTKNQPLLEADFLILTTTILSKFLLANFRLYPRKRNDGIKGRADILLRSEPDIATKISED